MSDIIASHVTTYQTPIAERIQPFPNPISAIFLDRDGVINRERANYVKMWQEFEFLPGALVALRQLAQLGRPIAVITNQSAIGRGIITRTTVDTIHHRLRCQVERAGGRIDAFFVCPHHPTDRCNCRKPQPGLLLQASQWFKIDLTHAIFIGDAFTDFQAAQSAGCQALLVRSGRQGHQLHAHYAGNSGTLLHDDLADAVSYTLQNLVHNRGKS